MQNGPALVKIALQGPFSENFSELPIILILYKLLNTNYHRVSDVLKGNNG
jgi:hypothetical protein